jgi:cell division protein ZapA
MGQVTVSLNGRSYRLRCGDGEEARLAELADYVGRRIDDLALEFGQFGDERLLLMVTLLLADEMLDLKTEVARLESALAASPRSEQAAAAADLQPLQTTAPRMDPLGVEAPPAAPAPVDTPEHPQVPSTDLPEDRRQESSMFGETAEAASQSQPRKLSPSRSSLEARLAEARGERHPGQIKPGPDAP